MLRWLFSCLMALHLALSAALAHAVPAPRPDVANAAPSSGLSSAVTGRDFREAFGSSFVRTVVALGLADVQNEIGDIFEKGAYGGEGSLGHILLHGLAGCAAAELQGADCHAGAVGGITQSIFAGIQDGRGPDAEEDPEAYKEWRQQVAEMAELLGAFTGFAFSGGDAENVSVSAAVSASGFVNNYLFHNEDARRSELGDLLNGAACEENFTAQCAAWLQEFQDLNELDRQRDDTLQQACFGGFSDACVVELVELQSAVRSYRVAGEAVYTNEALQVRTEYSRRMSDLALVGLARAGVTQLSDSAKALLYLSELAGSAVTGDPEALEEIRQLADDAVTFLTNDPVGTVKADWDARFAEADQLEASGDLLSAAELRAGVMLEIGTLATGGAGASVVVITKAEGLITSLLSDTPKTERLGRTNFDEQFSGQFRDQAQADEAYRQYRLAANTDAEIVLGRLPDTEAGSQLGMTRLDSDDWSPSVNDAFIQGGIDASRPFYLGSNPEISNFRAQAQFDASGNFVGRGDYPETVFLREMRQLRDAGYRLEGDYMLPPS